jgi:hypothetical protein
MTATPCFIYRCAVGREAGKRLAPRRLSSRTRSTPGRLRHTQTRIALALQRGRLALLIRANRRETP